MPLGVKPVCTSCTSNNSSMWSKNEKGEIICNACATKQTTAKEPAAGNGTAPKKGSSNSEHIQERVLRKSSRNKPSKYRIANSKPMPPKGKGRRVIFKKTQPVKAPTAISTVVTGESIFHEGLYYQVGDIVSLVDESESVYYAQIRGFLQDQYYEKSAVITWLLPTRTTTNNTSFDPSSYILGPEEDLPRKMEYMEFVCHTPSDYFKCRSKPYPTVAGSPDLCYIWSSVGPEIRPAPSMNDVYGPGITFPNDSQPSVVKKTKLDKVKVKSEKDDKRLIVVE